MRPAGQARSGLEGLFDLPNPGGRREQARTSAIEPEQTERATQLRERLRTWREKAGVEGSAELTKEEYDQLWTSDLP